MEPQSGNAASNVALFIGSNVAIAMQHHPRSIHQSISTPRYSATRPHVSHENLNVDNTISKTWRTKKTFKKTPSDIFP